MLGHEASFDSPLSTLAPSLQAVASRSAQDLLHESLDSVLLLCMVPQGREGLGDRVSCHLGYRQAHACLHCTGQLVTILHHMFLAGMLHLVQSCPAC